MNIPESPIRRPQLKRTLHLRAPPAPSLHVTSHARLVSSKLFSNTAFVQNLISYKHSMARASLQEIHQNFQSSHPFRCPAIGLKNTRVNTPALAISTIPQTSQTRCELHSTPPNSNSPSTVAKPHHLIYHIHQSWYLLSPHQLSRITATPPKHGHKKKTAKSSCKASNPALRTLQNRRNEKKNCHFQHKLLHTQPKKTRKNSSSAWWRERKTMTGTH
jgi:hypothetical protein